jgi:TonB family protein
MVGHRFVIVAVWAALTVVPAHGKSPVALEPLTDWQMGDPSPDACTALRFFGTEDAVHVLRLEQSWPSTGMELWVGGSSFRFFTTNEEINLQFREGGGKIAVRPVTGMLPGFGKTVITSFSQSSIDAGQSREASAGQERPASLSVLNPAAGAEVEFISLQRGSDAAVRLATGGLEAPFNMLNQCSLKLLEQWKLDPDKHLNASRQLGWLNEATITRKVMGSYRASGLNSGERGRIRVRLIVDEEGKVDGCTIIKAAATENLDSPVCEIMADARFEPALDATGQPFRSFYATAVTYQMRR